MKGSPTVSWNNLSRGEWDATLRKALAAYQQDWAYGDAIAAANPGVEVWRADVARPDGVRIALAQILCRRIAGMVRLAICTLGPVWVNDPGPEQKAAAYRELRRAAPLTFPGFLLFTPDESFDSEAGLKGRKRIMTGDATILLDLSQDQAALRAGLDGKWRNALVKAEKSDLRATRGGSKPAQYRWLLEAKPASDGTEAIARCQRPSPKNGSCAGRKPKP